MAKDYKRNPEIEEIETSEWLYSLDYVFEHGGPERVRELLQQLQIRAHKAGVQIPFTANTPYINTILLGATICKLSWTTNIQGILNKRSMCARII